MSEAEKRKALRTAILATIGLSGNVAAPAVFTRVADVLDELAAEFRAAVRPSASRSDGGACRDCGGMTVPTGACSTCRECGSTGGCG